MVCFVSQSSIDHLLKANDLIGSAAFTLVKAGGDFKDKTPPLDQLWRVDFRYLKGLQAIVKASVGAPSALVQRRDPSRAAGTLSCRPDA
jgi:hypothetical protein